MSRLNWANAATSRLARKAARTPSRIPAKGSYLHDLTCDIVAKRNARLADAKK